MQVVTIPSTATAFLSLEQKQGWTKQSGPAIESPNQPEPAVWDFTQVQPPPITPPIVMTLKTTGIKGSFCDWMCKAPPLIIPPTAKNCLIRTSQTFDNVAGIQSWEVGWRGTNAQKVTNNASTQLVRLSSGLMELDVVPGPSGGWKDTTIRFPGYQAGILYDEERYWTFDANFTTSLQYVMINGNLQAIPIASQNLVGAVQNPPWAPLVAIAEFQPDANASAIPFNPTVTMSVYFW
jgi:hypothetical protein